MNRKYHGKVHCQLEVGGAEGPAEVVRDEIVEVHEEHVLIRLADALLEQGGAGAPVAAVLA